MIKRNSSGSLYGIVYDQLVAKITSGEWKTGDQIPPELELCKFYDVSRITVRRALDEMMQKNLIRREIGKGTFVESSVLLSPRQQIYSFTNEIIRMGFTPGVKLLKRKEVRANHVIAEDLKIKPEEVILFIGRLRTANNQPLYIGESHFNTVGFPKLLEADFSENSLAKVIDLTLNLKVVRVEQWITACPVSTANAKLLELENGVPVLNMKRIVYVEGGIPVETVQVYFNPKHYTYYSEIILD
jgi:GntR family transcriptional regulator